MAKILSMPKGASKSKIYVNGAFGPGMENPGAYVLSPGTQPLSVGALIRTDRFVLDSNNAINTAAIIGTASQFDFTPYTLLYVPPSTMIVAASALKNEFLALSFVKVPSLTVIVAPLIALKM